MDRELLLEQFCRQQRLPPNYLIGARRWFLPLAEVLQEESRGGARPLIVGIHGCQGSGKSTLTLLLQQILTTDYALRVATLSLDDFY
ncbi:MAG: hypothetical protein HQL48_09855, partial [Gammaproteobacteria bacterium]|nr:hypothetical protein [Gammaproteobacteria bacterium]